jgi:electron transport complex protein RnfB
MNTAERTNRPARRKTPKHVAVIDRDHCTGCAACVEVCPVDCITAHRTGMGVMGSEAWCEIDAERCIGCRLCIRLPSRGIENFQLAICPWDAIDLVPTSSNLTTLSRK